MSVLLFLAKGSEDNESIKVRDWRHRLQKTFLSNKALPKEEVGIFFPSFLVLRLVQPLLVDFSCRLLLPSLFSTPRDSLHPNSFSRSFSLARIPIFNAPLPLLLSQPMLTNLVSQEMPNLNELFKTVENYEGMTIEQLQVCFCCCTRFHSGLGHFFSIFLVTPHDGVYVSPF